MSFRAVGIGAVFAAAAFAARPALAADPAPSLAPAATPAPAAPEAPAPHIKFDQTDINLGDVVHGQDAVATFTYRNTGNAPLHILSAKPG